MNIRLAKGEIGSEYSIGKAWERILEDEIDRARLVEQFFGRLEQVAGFRLPSWWVEIGRGMKFRSGLPFFSVPKSGSESEFRTQFAWRDSAVEISDMSDSDLLIEKADSHLKIAGRNVSVNVPEVPECFLVHGFVRGSDVLIAFPTSRPEPFPFSMFDLNAGKNSWTTTALGGYSPVPMEGRSSHFLDLIFDNRKLVWIFGFGPELIYAECFSLNDGRQQFCFNSHQANKS